MQILQKVKKIPQKILRKLSPASNKIALFDHKIAQEYEFNYAKTAIQSDFQTVSNAYQKRKPHYHTSKGQFFEGDEKLWKEFISHSNDKSALEIGSGPFGYLAFFDGPKEKYFIEPLIKRYRGFQLQTFDKTFFPEEKNLFDVPAEFFVQDLKNKIDGFIVCRNCIDHADDPLQILWNISQYAATGSYLLFWVENWHFTLDEGHRNITKNPKVLEALLSGLGFEVLKTHTLPGDTCINYGCVARKIK